MPKVSVIIATYNRAHFICEAIDSALNQTFKDFEIIVVDDGSSDNTREVLEKYGSTIYCIYHQVNKGRAEARNTGIKNAKCEYIAFLDDDDIWLPHKLEEQVAFLDSHPEIGLVHTFTETVDEQGHLLKKETKNRFKLYKKAMKLGYTYEGMSRLCVMFLSTVMARKKCFDKGGIFDSSIPAFEDWDLYLRIALYYRIDTITEPLVKYRLHKGQCSISEFISGRIQTSLKHLSLINSGRELCRRGKVSYNFYMHLVIMYYIASDFTECRKYALQALKLKPFALFRSQLGFYLLMMLLPFNFIRWIRQVEPLGLKADAPSPKQKHPSQSFVPGLKPRGFLRRGLKKNSRLNKLQMYPQRIIPKETYGGPLAAHLKRY
ncbi:MAG: glycosyltransferase family 2 protein, partial [Candidatus Omnitrophota bacterium]|nr:glycosyltransferase family 2 protein [Candidatus Omnitrophota bacterium]